MKSSKRKICSAVALVLSAMAASAAMAQTPSLIGGGSSLVGPSINAEIAIFPSSDGSITYFTSSSGVGQTAFLNNEASAFGATVTGTVDFANSDAALSASQLSAYTASGGLAATNGPLIQIPYIVTPITIPLVNAPTGTGPSLPLDTTNTPTVALNDADLCGIFSGALTNWNQVVNPDTGSAYSLNAPITVVYRSDNSGTTDLLTRHLAAVCGTASTPVASGVTFVETQNFKTVFPLATAPSNFIGESGSSGVANELTTLRSASTAAIGYLSPDYTNSSLATSTTAPAATNNLSVASLLNSNLPTAPAGSNVNDIVPTAAQANTAVKSFAPPTTKMLVKAQANWVPNANNPTTGYPISGTSNIIVSQCYANPAANSPSPALAVVDFLTDHYENSSFISIVTSNGFTTVPSNYLTQIEADFLGNSSGFNLDIGDSTVCSGSVTGR